METSLPLKTVRRRKTKAKSRTIARPALSGKKPWLSTAKIVLGFGYAAAIIIIFQFVAVQFAIGSPRTSTPISPSGQLAPTDLEYPQLPERSVNALIVAEKKPAAKPQPPRGLPVRLKIPALRINAVIRAVGLLPDKSMGVPKLPHETAWYEPGAKPGEIGTAVIAGHVNWWNGAAGVFGKIKTLKPGDTITVQNDRGENTVFTVRETKEYNVKDQATEVFVSYDGKSHLNLVTCSGVWNRTSRLYSKRIVVFAEKATK